MRFRTDWTAARQPRGLGEPPDATRAGSATSRWRRSGGHPPGDSPTGGDQRRGLLGITRWARYQPRRLFKNPISRETDMKISGVDIRPGNIIEYEGGIWRAVKIQHTQP